MIKSALLKFLEFYGYKKVKKPYTQTYSILNSREYVLEEKQDQSKVISFIKSIRPYNIGKELIRVGSKKDGGYLVPNDLEGIIACFSAGVSKVSEFENHCHELGIQQLFLADKSVEKANLNVAHHFLPKFIGITNNNDFITMDEWVNQSVENTGDLLLQMDIEGAEYNSFINMSDALLSRFRILVVEFHDLHKLWTKYSYNIITDVFNKILQTHVCVHIHPNNYSGIDIQEDIAIPRFAEFTFIRKDRVITQTPCTSFPHPLDFDNTNFPHIVLPEIWYK
ncbi:MAG: FkbM family methyltransferase [Chitinophagales bacterium]|nr:FkbM family methyltransferase [Chitinophagales bacterium]